MSADAACTEPRAPAPRAPGFAEARSAFRPDIEGLRAVAVLLVVAYHAGVPGVAGGYIGVDVFFVLSGYLITGLLVREAAATGTVALAAFYARRARRLLPALLAVVAATVAASAVVFAPAEQVGLARSAFSAAAYVSNVRFARAQTDYLGAAAEADPFLHTWSLSVEEQFYAVWPLFVLAGLGVLGRRGAVADRRRLAAWLGGALALSFALGLWWTATRQPWAFFLSPPRAWEFAAGALAVLARPPQAGPSWSGRAERALGWAGLAGILAAATLFGGTTPFPGVAALLPAVSTVLVLRATQAAGLQRLLGWRPLQHAGRLSYSWYLWHWPVLVVGAALVPDAPLAVRLGLVAGSLGLAHASYRLVEQPVRRSARLSPWRSLAATGVATAAGVALALGWGALAARSARSDAQARYTDARADLPAVYASGCHADVAATQARGCASGDTRAARTVVLLGDSHAAQWHPALDALALARGWRLVTLTRSSCPAVDVEVFSRFAGRTDTECGLWRRSALAAVARLRPALVVVASEGAYGLSPAEWEAGTARVLAHLSRSAARVVVLRDTPAAAFDVPMCAARGAWRPDVWRRVSGAASCSFPAVRPEASAVWAAQARAAGVFATVATADLTGAVCPGGTCRPERGGRPTYRDAHHLTAGYARSLAPALGARLGLEPAPQASATPGVSPVAHPSLGRRDAD